MMEIVLLVMLLYNSVTDIKYRTIDVLPNILAGCAGGLFRILRTPGDWAGILWGTLPGIILFLLSYILQNGIGKGDGLIFLMTGCWLDGGINVSLLIGTCFLAAIFSGGLLAANKANRQTELPMAPFALISYLGMTAL